MTELRVFFLSICVASLILPLPSFANPSLNGTVDELYAFQCTEVSKDESQRPSEATLLIGRKGNALFAIGTPGITKVTETEIGYQLDSPDKPPSFLSKEADGWRIFAISPYGIEEASCVDMTEMVHVVLQALEAESITLSIPAVEPMPEPAPSEDLPDSVVDGIQVAITRCWNVGSLSSDALKTKIWVNFSIDDGLVAGDSIVLSKDQGESSRAEEEAYQAAKRAILRCSVRGYDVPDGYYDLTVLFDPQRMKVQIKAQ